MKGVQSWVYCLEGEIIEGIKRKSSILSAAYAQYGHTGKYASKTQTWRGLSISVEFLDFTTLKTIEHMRYSMSCTQAIFRCL